MDYMENSATPTYYRFRKVHMLEGAYVAGQPTSDGLEEGDINGPFSVKKPVGT